MATRRFYLGDEYHQRRSACRPCARIDDAQRHPLDAMTSTAAPCDKLPHCRKSRRRRVLSYDKPLVKDSRLPRAARQPVCIRYHEDQRDFKEFRRPLSQQPEDPNAFEVLAHRVRVGRRISSRAADDPHLAID